MSRSDAALRREFEWRLREAGLTLSVGFTDALWTVIEDWIGDASEAREAYEEGYRDAQSGY